MTHRGYEQYLPSSTESGISAETFALDVNVTSPQAHAEKTLRKLIITLSFLLSSVHLLVTGHSETSAGLASCYSSPCSTTPYIKNRLSPPAPGTHQTSHTLFCLNKLLLSVPKTYSDIPPGVGMVEGGTSWASSSAEMPHRDSFCFFVGVSC